MSAIARLAIPLLLVSARTWAGGYNFSISGSASDAFINTAAATGGIRNIYLWLTCTQDGISTFEGDVTGTLGVLAFTTMNGVMNAGGAQNLLLTIPGCPQGTSVKLPDGVLADSRHRGNALPRAISIQCSDWGRRLR